MLENYLYSCGIFLVVLLSKVHYEDLAERLEDEKSLTNIQFLLKRSWLFVLLIIVSLLWPLLVLFKLVFPDE